MATDVCDNDDSDDAQSINNDMNADARDDYDEYEFDRGKEAVSRIRTHDNTVAYDEDAGSRDNR